MADPLREHGRRLGGQGEKRRHGRRPGGPVCRDPDEASASGRAGDGVRAEPAGRDLRLRCGLLRPGLGLPAGGRSRDGGSDRAAHETLVGHRHRSSRRADRDRWRGFRRDRPAGTDAVAAGPRRRVRHSAHLPQENRLSGQLARGRSGDRRRRPELPGAALGGAVLWRGSERAEQPLRLVRNRPRVSRADSDLHRDRLRSHERAPLRLRPRPLHLHRGDHGRELPPRRLRRDGGAGLPRGLRPPLRGDAGGRPSHSQQLPLAALPRSLLPNLVQRQSRAGRGRASHRALFHRLGNPSGAGGRDRPGPRAEGPRLGRRLGLAGLSVGTPACSAKDRLRRPPLLRLV